MGKLSERFHIGQSVTWHLETPGSDKKRYYAGNIVEFHGEDMVEVSFVRWESLDTIMLHENEVTERPDDAMVCEYCGKTVSRNYGMTEHVMCEDCHKTTEYHTCDDCGKILDCTHEDDCLTDGEVYICYDCADRPKWVKCDGCGRVLHESVYHKDGQAYYCDECWHS